VVSSFVREKSIIIQKAIWAYSWNFLLYLLSPFLLCLTVSFKIFSKSCLVQLTGLFQQIISFRFLKKQKVDTLFLITEYQPAWSTYKISAAAYDIPCSSPFRTTGGAAPSPGHKSTRLPDLCSHLSCRHWYLLWPAERTCPAEEAQQSGSMWKAMCNTPRPLTPLLQQAASNARQARGQHTHRQALAPQLRARSSYRGD